MGTGHAPASVLAKCLGAINLASIVAALLSFVFFRFESAAFWGSTAFVNLALQIAFVGVFFFFVGLFR